MNLTFAANLTKMIDAGLGREAAPPETFVAVGQTTEYTDLGPVPIASFETNAAALLRALSVALEPIQAGTGDPSPENVRPISGRQSVTVTRAGKNLLDYNLTDLIYSTAENQRYGIYWTKPGTYVVSASGSGLVWRKKTADGVYGDPHYLPAAASETLNEGDSIIVFNPNGAFTKAATINMMVNNHVQLELGSTATAYEPYNGESVTIPLDQTVYGGSLDVVAGKLYSEWANIASYDGEELPGEWISSMDVYSEGATPTTGAQVCYKLAEPVEIDLDLEQITTLIGHNNVWSDGGDVSLTYGTTRYTEGY